LTGDVATTAPLLSLADGPELRARLRGPFSETSFANLYLFRRVHNYRVIEGPLPHVEGRTYDGTRHLLPLFDPVTASPEALRRLLRGGRVLYPVSEETTLALAAQGFVAAWNDADSDYFYNAEAMSELEGARAKRSQARKFEREWNPEVRDVEGSTLADAQCVLDRWQADVDKPWAQTDYEACAEALGLRDQLGMFGLVTYAKGEPAGLVLTSEAADGTVVVHFAKGGRAFDGVFPYMFRELARRVKSSSRCLNFEQDLGNPGFRQSKRAFAPAAWLRKYRVGLQGE
jgi:hypothetical protein